MLEVTMLPLDQIMPRHGIRCQAHVKAIQKSIVENGFLKTSPLFVREREQEHEQYPFRLLDGHHRHAAAERAGLKEVPAISFPSEMTMSDEMYDALMLRIREWIQTYPMPTVRLSQVKQTLAFIEQTLSPFIIGYRDPLLAWVRELFVFQCRAIIDVLEKDKQHDFDGIKAELKEMLAGEPHEIYQCDGCNNFHRRTPLDTRRNVRAIRVSM